MNSGFASIDGKSTAYRMAVAVLAALALAGFICFTISYTQGHRVYGGSNAVPWGLPIVLAIYLIGLSAGSLILSSLTYVLGREEYRPLGRLAVYLAIVLIFGAMLAIAMDLGRPEKFWRLFMFFYLNNMTSMFAINGILYAGYFTISLVYLGVILAEKGRAARITGIIAAGWAVLVHMGTGAIFGFVAARETWYSPVRPLEFLSAALASGIALLLMAGFTITRLSRKTLKNEIFISLGRFLAVAVVILLILIALDKITHLYSPSRQATLYLLVGPNSWLFWVFQVGLGMFLPLIVLFHPQWGKTGGAVVLAAAAVMFGVFFERYYLVIPGAAYPMPYAAGKIEGVWGAPGIFRLAPIEITAVTGLVALLVLIFILGLKNLQLLPGEDVPPPETHPDQEVGPPAGRQARSTSS